MSRDLFMELCACRPRRREAPDPPPGQKGTPIDDDAAFFALVKAMLARASVLSWGMLSSGDRLQHLEREGSVPDQLKILPVEGKQLSPKPASVESQKDVVQHLLDLGLPRRLLPGDAGDERSGVLPVLEVGGGDTPARSSAPT